MVRDMKLPTLLVLTSTYPRWPGDPEPGFVHELARRLTPQFNVIVMGPHAPGARSREIMDGVEVIRYRYAPERYETLVNDGGVVSNLRKSPFKWLLVPSFLFMQVWYVWRLLRTRQIDLLHAHWLIPQGLVAALFSSKAPFMVTSHGADLFALRGGLLKLVKKFVANKASAVSVVSEPMREKLRSIGAEMDKVFVLPMGVDLEYRFTPSERIVRSSREMLFVGRLVEKKGLRHLIAAMPKIIDHVPSAVLTIVGFGPEELALKRQVAELDIGNHVRFVGAVAQTELPDLYRRAAIFVAPFIEASSGDQEGLGLVLVEAAGCLCPIVSGDVPAVRGIVDDASCRVDVRKADLLSEAILRVLEAPGVASERAAQMRTRLFQSMDWQSVATGYVGALMAILPRSIHQVRRVKG